MPWKGFPPSGAGESTSFRPGIRIFPTKFLKEKTRAGKGEGKSAVDKVKEDGRY